MIKVNDMNLSKYGVMPDNKILNIALTHTSYSNEHGCLSYERLEFLGDAVLQLIMSDYFYKNSNYDEGEMSKIRASYVCESALDEYAKIINLKDYIKVGHGLEHTINETIVADVFEAVIAAIYLNSGYSKAKEFVMDISMPFIKNKTKFMSDYKSYLQELVQTDKKSVTYNVIKEKGPAHDKTFEVEVIVDNMVYGKGIGKSKKEAEQDAAKNAILLSVGDDNETFKN